MAAYDLEEQEQISELKAWWAQYGNLVTATVLALAVGVFGWNAWTWYQRDKATQAATVFGAAQKAAAAHDAKNVAAAAAELIERYPGTAQAALAALLSAKLNVDAGDVETARTQLAWAASSAAEPELRDIARLRLASVLLDEKAYDEALKQIEAEPVASFAARFDDLRGDIHAAQGKPAEAKKDYETALAKVDQATKSGTAASGAEGRFKQVLQLKLESLGVAP